MRKTKERLGNCSALKETKRRKQLNEICDSLLDLFAMKDFIRENGEMGSED